MSEILTQATPMMGSPQSGKAPQYVQYSMQLTEIELGKPIVKSFLKLHGYGSLMVWW